MQLRQIAAKVGTAGLLPRFRAGMSACEQGQPHDVVSRLLMDKLPV